MIDKIVIKNYKSIKEMELSLGRVTVLIGENGAGKSNILEAIALSSAALTNHIDNEFLASRGIRIPEPEFMRASFNQNEEGIELELYHKGDITPVRVSLGLRDSGTIKKWHITRVINLNINRVILDYEELKAALESVLESNAAADILSKLKKRPSEEVSEQDFLEKEDPISKFLIYSPAYTTLRTFQAEGQILPLGIRGEGLFAHLKALGKSLPEKYKEIVKHLHILDWFEHMEMGSNPAPFETTLQIRDRFLYDELLFDQRSVNEGFFFLLFYLTLIVSPETPGFFAIDNVDASLNPKLCRRIMKDVVSLSKEYDKQLILTTHNPAILDGLNLNDEEQRLLVVKRNSEGHTIVQRIPPPKKKAGGRAIKLSEAFMRGYIGGLPENF